MKYFKIKLSSIFTTDSIVGNTEKYLLNSLLIVLLFLFINPIYAILLTTYFSVNHNYSKSTTLLTLILSFSLFFFSRKYDVYFYFDSTDDVPVYIDYYLKLSSISIGGIFENFLINPSGNEPFWHLIWWIVNRMTNSNVNIFIFLHYLLIFYFFAKITINLSPKYFEISFLLILFLFPVTLYNVCHIWRQILSFEFFLYGALLYYQKNKKTNGYIFIILSVFTHVSSLYFFLIFLSSNIFFNFAVLTKKNIILFSTTILIFISFGFQVFLLLLGETFLRLANYTEAASADRNGLDIKLVIYIVVTIYAFAKSKITKFNSFLFINIIIPLFLPFIFPAYNAIYDRYFSLALTLLSVYLFIITTNVYGTIIYIREKKLFFFTSVLLFINFMKLYYEYSNGIGVISYIGYSNAFRLNNGIFVLLFQLIN